ncbi:unnamed protein product [Diamesa hyperborea]
MMFTELFVFSFILCQVLGYKLQCTKVEKDILRDKNGKLYLMHSFTTINNHSFEEDSELGFHLPLTHTSERLISIVEYSNSSYYIAQIQSAEHETFFDLKAMKVNEKTRAKEYCGYRNSQTYFALVIKTNRPKEEMNSIILYGCDILTSSYVTVLLIESDNYSLDAETIDVLFQTHRISNFPLHGATDNQGFCMCPSSRKYVADCFESQEYKNRSFNINMFWIIIGVIIILIILLFALN